MKKLLKEFIVYLLSLIVVAIIQHPDILSDPLTRLIRLEESTVYGMSGFIHPLVFGFVGYLLVGIVRLTIIKPVVALFRKKDKNSPKNR
jgi:hypothetical protein